MGLEHEYLTLDRKNHTLFSYVCAPPPLPRWVKDAGKDSGE